MAFEHLMSNTLEMMLRLVFLSTLDSYGNELMGRVSRSCSHARCYYTNIHLYLNAGRQLESRHVS
jgi:hypothetical protein